MKEILLAKGNILAVYVWKDVDLIEKNRKKFRIFTKLDPSIIKRFSSFQKFLAGKNNFLEIRIQKGIDSWENNKKFESNIENCKTKFGWNYYGWNRIS